MTFFREYLFRKIKRFLAEEFLGPPRAQKKKNDSTNTHQYKIKMKCKYLNPSKVIDILSCGWDHCFAAFPLFRVTQRLSLNHIRCLDYWFWINYYFSDKVFINHLHCAIKGCLYLAVGDLQVSRFFRSSSSLFLEGFRVCFQHWKTLLNKLQLKQENGIALKECYQKIVCYVFNYCRLCRHLLRVPGGQIDYVL